MPSALYCGQCLSTFESNGESCPNLSCGAHRPNEGWGLVLTNGDVLDRHYRIEKCLAVGGAGLTYLARELGPSGDPIGPRLAIKILYSARATGPFLRRLATEAQILQELAHDNIVELRGFVHRAGMEPYLVTRFEEGGSLASHVDRVGPLSPGVAGAVLRQVLKGLDVAHRRGVVHRDLKPDNVLLAERVPRDVVPHVRIADFGIAKISGGVGDKLTRTGAFVGTPEFAAPEQFDGKTPTPATDVFAVGTLLVFLLTGKPPFKFDHRSDIEASRDQMLAQWPLRLPAIPGADQGALQQLLEGMTRLDPAQRSTIDEVLSALVPIADDEDTFTFEATIPPDLDRDAPPPPPPSLDPTPASLEETLDFAPAPPPSLAEEWTLGFARPGVRPDRHEPVELISLDAPPPPPDAPEPPGTAFVQPPPPPPADPGAALVPPPDSGAPAGPGTGLAPLASSGASADPVGPRPPGQRDPGDPPLSDGAGGSATELAPPPLGAAAPPPGAPPPPPGASSASGLRDPATAFVPSPGSASPASASPPGIASGSAPPPPPGAVADAGSGPVSGPLDDTEEMLDGPGGAAGSPPGSPETAFVLRRAPPAAGPPAPPPPPPPAPAGTPPAASGVPGSASPLPSTAQPAGSGLAGASPPAVPPVSPDPPDRPAEDRPVPAPVEAGAPPAAGRVTPPPAPGRGTPHPTPVRTTPSSDAAPPPFVSTRPMEPPRGELVLRAEPAPRAGRGGGAGLVGCFGLSLFGMGAVGAGGLVVVGLILVVVAAGMGWFGRIPATGPDRPPPVVVEPPARFRNAPELPRPAQERLQRVVRDAAKDIGDQCGRGGSVAADLLVDRAGWVVFADVHPERPDAIDPVCVARRLEKIRVRLVVQTEGLAHVKFTP